MQNKNFFVPLLFILALFIAACEQAVQDGVTEEINNFEDCKSAGGKIYFSQPPQCEINGKVYQKSNEITNFEECAAAGNPIVESYPRQCKTPDGKTYIEQVDKEIEKTITIEGEIDCLPSKRGTQECAYGLKSDEGNYYSLQNLNQQDIIDGLVTTGTRVKVNGKLTPPSENLLASYEIVGQIDIDTVAYISPLFKKIPTRVGDLTLEYGNGQAILSGILSRSTPCVDLAVEAGGTKDLPRSEVAIRIFDKNKGIICIQMLGEPQEIYQEIEQVSQETSYTVKLEQEIVFEGKLTAETYSIGRGTSDTIELVDPEKLGLYNYSDYPLDSITTKPISPKYIVEHRSALNEKKVVVKGIIVDAKLKTECPSGGADGPAIGAPCIGPRMVLADTADKNRDKNYDISIFIRDGENYKIGDVVEINAIVYSSKSDVNLQKLY